MKGLTTAIGIGLVVAFILVETAVRAPGESAADKQKVRLGVYDSRAVAVAYVQAHRDDEQLKQLSTELKQAEAAGQKERAAAIKAKGERLQTLRHLQGFSNAPVDDLLKPLAARLPEIARDAGVSAIVARVDFSDEQVAVVDVTDKLVSEFQPDARTLKMIADLRSHKPMPMLDILGLNPNE